MKGTQDQSKPLPAAAILYDKNYELQCFREDLTKRDISPDATILRTNNFFSVTYIYTVLKPQPCPSVF